MNSRMTAKLPTLIAGIIAILGGLVASNRGRFSVGVVLILLGLAFVIYSSTIKDWCIVHEHGWSGAQTWGDAKFGETLGECLKEKGWLEF